MPSELSEYVLDMVSTVCPYNIASILATNKQCRLKVIAAKEELEDFDRLTENGRQKAAAHARLEVKRSRLCAKIQDSARLALSLNEWTPPTKDHYDLKLAAFDNLLMVMKCAIEALERRRWTPDEVESTQGERLAILRDELVTNLETANNEIEERAKELRRYEDWQEALKRSLGV